MLRFQVRVAYRSVDPVLRLLREHPALTFDRPYAGYLLFLFGQSDEKVATWFSRNLVALDSLTGSTIAGIVFADRVKIRVEVEPGRNEREGLSEVPIGEIQSGYDAHYRYDRLVSDDGKSSFRTEKEITALTYAADAVARRMNLTSDLPCIVILDAIPTREFEILRLSNRDSAEIIPLLRDLFTEFTAKDRYHRFFELLENVHAASREIDDLTGKATAARTRSDVARATPLPETLSWPLKARAALMADNLREFRSAIQSAPAQEKARILQNLKTDARMLAGLSKTISTLQHYCARWPLTGDEHTRLGTIFRSHVCQYICATETAVLGVDRVKEAVTQLAEVRRTLQAKYLAEIPDVSRELADFSETIDRQSTDLEAEANLREDEVRERARQMGQLVDELKQCEVPRLQEAFRRLAARTGIKLKTRAYGTAVADWIGGFLKPEILMKIAEALGKSIGHPSA